MKWLQSIYLQSIKYDVNVMHSNMNDITTICSIILQRILLQYINSIYI